MGKREKQAASKSKSKPEDLLETLGDFTSKENWDKFFTIRGVDDSFEWYADWPELRQPLLSHLSGPLPPSLSDASDGPTASTSVPSQVPLQILVPGCGNSRLSEHLYDAGFKEITNIDFSKVVIGDMLRRNVRERPGMRWRVMDMTQIQFADGTYEIILDKGGLDALMEPELGPQLGNQYLSEVKRIVKAGGKFICLTLAESHVVGLLFSKFRFGWKMSVQAIPPKPSIKPNLLTFMVVAEKESCTFLQPIEALFGTSLSSRGNQVSGLLEALENENQIRREYSSGSDILYSLEDLQLGAIGDVSKVNPGRRFRVILGAEGISSFNYRAVLLDAREDFAPFSYHCGVFIVPKTRAHEWLFSSEEGQWMVVESSKAARLIMVILDSSHSSTSMDAIQKDLSPLVKQLAPGTGDDDAQIPFMMASDGIKERNIVHQVTSALTGPAIVEDVVYENADNIRHPLPSKDLMFRRLVFERTRGLVQSEALLIRDESSLKVEVANKKSSSSSKSKKRGNQKRKNESNNLLVVYHDYLASSYHMGIISGFMLISSYLESVSLSEKPVNAVVIGLGAGLLPMYLRRSVPFLNIEVVELDPVVFSLAKDYFGFTEDGRLKAHITDGIKFVRERKTHAAADAVPKVHANEIANGNTKSSQIESPEEVPVIDILIVDVDSSDSSTGMTCPAADFVDESFLLTVKDTLSEEGIFIVNLVSRSSAVKDMVISRMKSIFSHLYSLQLEEDVNMVLFALCSRSSIKEDKFSDAAAQLEKLLKFKHPEIREGILDATRKIRSLK